MEGREGRNRRKVFVVKMFTIRREDVIVELIIYINNLERGSVAEDLSYFLWSRVYWVWFYRMSRLRKVFFW